METGLVTNWSELAATSPVLRLMCASPANSTRGSLTPQPGLTACRLLTVILLSVTSSFVLVATTLAASSQAPSIFQVPGANHGFARVSQRAMLPVERTVIGQAASLLERATALARRASSWSP